MCLIIDNNVTHLMVDPNNLDAVEINKWILKRGRIVTGGKLRKEQTDREVCNFKFVALMNKLHSAGRVIFINDDDVNSEELNLIQNHTLQSNDHHVVALARVSGARALWSLDVALRKDFSRKALIDSPRAKFYMPNGNPRRRKVNLKAINTVCRCR